MNQYIIIFVFGALVVVFLWYLWIQTYPPGAGSWHLMLISGLLVWMILFALLFPESIDLSRNHYHDSERHCLSISEQYVLEPMKDGGYYETYQDKTILRIKIEDGDVREIIVPRDKVTYRNAKDKAMVRLLGGESNDEEMEYEEVVVYLPGE